MKQARRFLWGFLLALSVLWWCADATDWAALPNVFAWRNVLLQYSGALSIGVMSVAMLLAVRPVLFEAQLGGLDKMYRLHKWLTRLVPDWKNAELWFCGPARFGQTLRRGLVAMGLDGRSFHQELFEMR